MDFSKLSCCSSFGDLKIENFSVGKGVLSDIGRFMQDYHDVTLVFDSNTYRACAEQVQLHLLNKKVTTHIFERDGVLIPNEDAVFELEAKMPEGCDLLIGVGSGVINDICKFVSHKKGIEYIIVATAPSMDGYVSKGAAMIWKGMKETFNTHTPMAVVADTEILVNAPMDMIRAGYGDIIGKYSALCDWKLSALVNGEYFDPAIYEYTMDMVKKTAPLAKSLQERDEQSIKTLTEALLGVGVAMACLGNSRPASGSEHHLSHFFEITGIIDQTPYLPHGTDVAYATWLTAKMRERIVQEAEFVPCKAHSQEQYEANIARVYTKISQEVLALQAKMGRYEPQNIQATNLVYKEKWSQVKEILAQMPSASEIRELLCAVGLDVNELYKTYTHAHIKDAYLYAKDLKDRYTVLWLYNALYADELEGKLPLRIYTGAYNYGHIQGIAADVERGCIYCSFTTALVKLDLLGNEMGSVCGLIGHLGCLAMGDDHKIYGSLEYKNDAIGKAIAQKCKAVSEKEGFYVAIFDGDKIDRANMDAEADKVMTAVYLPQVLEDYLYCDGSKKHKYGCSGIDGISFGYDFGSFGGKKYLCVCYGIYSDTERNDNDMQVILQLDPAHFDGAAKPLAQGKMHESAVVAAQKFFVYTGNTTYGVQNFEYDAATGAWYMAVYRGKKEKFPNYSMYAIDASLAPFEDELDGERVLMLSLLEDGLFDSQSGIFGYDFPYGSTGFQSLGNGYYYVSHNMRDQNGAHASNICLYRYNGDPKALFVRA